MTKRTTIIDFVNEYVDKYKDETYLREKVNGVWTETSFNKTREEARLLAAGFMALGLKKGDKVITAGGIYGVIADVEERTVLLKVDGDVKIRVDKTSIVRDTTTNQQ